MPGIVVFTSLAEAIRAGFSVVERKPYGYLVVIKTSAGAAFAEVHVKGGVR